MLILAIARLRPDLYWRGRFALVPPLSFRGEPTRLMRYPIPICDWKMHSTGVFEVVVTDIGSGGYNTPSGAHPQQSSNSNYNVPEWRYFRLITATVLKTYMTDGVTGSVVVFQDDIKPDVELGILLSLILHEEAMKPVADIDVGDKGIIFPSSPRHYTDSDYYESTWRRPEVAPMETFWRSFVLNLRANAASDATAEYIFNWYWFGGDYAISTKDRRIMPITQLTSEIEQCPATPSRG